MGLRAKNSFLREKVDKLYRIKVKMLDILAEHKDVSSINSPKLKELTFLPNFHTQSLFNDIKHECKDVYASDSNVDISHFPQPTNLFYSKHSEHFNYSGERSTASLDTIDPSSLYPSFHIQTSIECFSL